MVTRQMQYSFWPSWSTTDIHIHHYWVYLCIANKSQTYGFKKSFKLPIDYTFVEAGRPLMNTNQTERHQWHLLVKYYKEPIFLKIRRLLHENLKNHLKWESYTVSSSLDAEDYLVTAELVCLSTVYLIFQNFGLCVVCVCVLLNGDQALFYLFCVCVTWYCWCDILLTLHWCRIFLFFNLLQIFQMIAFVSLNTNKCVCS